MDLFKDRAARTMEIGRTAPPFDDDEYIFEIKLDGERCLAYLDGSGTDLINRRGNRVLAKLPELANLHKQANGRCIVDGELVVVQDGKPNFEEIKRRVATTNPQRVELMRRQAPATFVAFDILYKDGKSLVDEPLAFRKEILAHTVGENERISLSRHIGEYGAELFENAVEHGLEGVVGKRIDSRYQMGKRTGDWVKCKNTLDDEYVVCGFIQQAEYVASLVLGQYNAMGNMVYKGHATLALSGEDFARISALPRRKAPPFKEALPPGNQNVQWVKPELVCTVEYLKLGPTGLMRHPVYKGLRDDKAPVDAVERAQE